MNPDAGIAWLILSEAAEAVSDRVFPGVARQGTEVPYICHHFQGEDQGHYLTAPDGCPKGRWIIEVWDSQPDRAANIAAAVRRKMNDFVGKAGTVTFKLVRAALGDSDQDFDQSSPTGFWYRRRIDVTAFYEENPTPLAVAR